MAIASLRSILFRNPPFTHCSAAPLPTNSPRWTRDFPSIAAAMALTPSMIGVAMSSWGCVTVSSKRPSSTFSIYSHLDPRDWLKFLHAPPQARTLTQTFLEKTLMLNKKTKSTTLNGMCTKPSEIRPLNEPSYLGTRFYHVRDDRVMLQAWFKFQWYRGPIEWTWKYSEESWRASCYDERNLDSVCSFVAIFNTSFTTFL